MNGQEKGVTMANYNDRFVAVFILMVSIETLIIIPVSRNAGFVVSVGK